MQIISWETICMKYQSLFFGKNKKTVISLLFAELANRANISFRREWSCEAASKHSIYSTIQ